MLFVGKTRVLDSFSGINWLYGSCENLDSGNGTGGFCGVCKKGHGRLHRHTLDSLEVVYLTTKSKIHTSSLTFVLNSTIVPMLAVFAVECD